MQKSFWAEEGKNQGSEISILILELGRVFPIPVTSGIRGKGDVERKDVVVVRGEMKYPVQIIPADGVGISRISSSLPFS